MDELTIIAAAADLPRVGGGVIVGIGDDAAVVTPATGFSVMTLDTLAEGTHFTRAWSSAADVGWKAMAVNLSDLAAMGATPRHALLGLTLPDDLATDWLDGFFDGLGQACTTWGVPVVGGDTVRGPGLVVTLTLTGECDRPLLRKGAAPGWLIAVTGALGGAAAGLHALQSGKPAPEAALLRWRRPTPRLDAGRALQALDIPMVCCDCSDGLVVSADLLTEGLGLELNADRLPLDAAALAVSGGPEQAMDWAMVGGEDYELVVAFPPEQEEGIRAAIAPLPLTVVGQVLAPPDRWLLRGGRRGRLPAHWGFRHF